MSRSLALVLCLLLACDGPQAPQGGALSVRAVSSGPAVVTATYGVSVDGVTYTGLNGTAPLVIAPVPAGDHQIELTGLPVLCAVEGEQPRTVNVTQGDTAVVEFAVRCEQAAGTVLVTAASEGQEIDPNGYRVLVDGSVQGELSIAGALTLTVPPGPHIVELGHLTANCSAAQNPREITVPSAGSQITTHFAVSCQMAPPAGRGHEIAFFSDRNIGSSQGGIFLMNEDGTGIRPLPNSVGPIGFTHLAWSPDGSRLVLSGLDELDEEQLYVLDLSGGEPTPIPNTEGGSDPAWSPDGTRIAYVGNPSDPQIWVVDVNGANAHQVSSETGSVLPSSPSWAPDGNRIAFVSEEFLEDFTIRRIVIRDLRDASRVVVHELEFDFLGYVAWSPEGTRLAFSAESPSFDFQIQVLDLAEGAKPRTVSSGRNDISPTWSPDGTRIGFTRSFFDHSEIYTMNGDGTEEIKITTEDGFEQEPAWRP